MAPVLHVTSVPWDEDSGASRRIRRLALAVLVDGDPFRFTLASLHANPAHSALRRARCFDVAATSIARRIEYESMGAATARTRRLAAVRASYGSARIVTTWSVR